MQQSTDSTAGATNNTSQLQSTEQQQLSKSVQLTGAGNLMRSALAKELSSSSMMSMMGGNNHAFSLALKEAKDELRLSKKSEQLTKEKLQETTKKLEQTEETFQRYKIDAEGRLDTLRSENSMLNMRLQNMHEQNEHLERTSNQSQSHSATTTPDMYKLVEEYSKTNELKSREIEELLGDIAARKQKFSQLKKVLSETEHRSTRLSSKLENMTKFCRIFIKSIKLQNQNLRDTVKQQQNEFQNVFGRCDQEIQQLVQTKLAQTKAHFETLLANEREHISTLKASLLNKDSTVSQQIKLTQDDQVNALQKELQLLAQKNEKQKKKISTILASQSSNEGQASLHALDVHKLQITSQQQKHELQLAEKDNVIAALKDTINTMKQREQQLVTKLENVDVTARQEYQRLIELHEGGSRYRELRDLYEEKLNKRDQQLMDTKEQLIKSQVRLEFVQADLTKVTLNEQYFQKQAQEFEKLQREKVQRVDDLQKELNGKETTILQQDAALQNLKITKSQLDAKVSDLDNTLIEIKSSHAMELSELKADFDNSKSKLQQELESIKTTHQKELFDLTEKFAALNADSQQQLLFSKQDLQDLTNQLSQTVLKSQADQQRIQSLQNQLSGSINDSTQGKFQQLTLANEIKTEEVIKLRIDLSEMRFELEEKVQQLEVLRQQQKKAEEQLSVSTPPITKQTKADHYVVQLENELKKLETEMRQIQLENNKLRESQHKFELQSIQKVECQNMECQTDLLLNSEEVIIMNKAATFNNEQIGQVAQNVTAPVQAFAQVQKPQQRQTGNPMQPKMTRPTAPIKKAGFQKPQPVFTMPQSQKIEEPIPQQVEKMPVETELTTTPVIKEQVKESEIQNQPTTIESQPIIQEEQKSLETEKSAKAVKKPEVSQHQTNQTDQNGFFSNILGSLMNLVSRRKAQAFTGRPASAMYYDENKKRWIINGEDESDDDVPPPPPPKAKAAPLVQEEVKPVETQIVSAPSQPTGLNSLTQAGFTGALANRNRNKKPSGPSAVPVQKINFPTPIPTTSQAEPEPVQEQKVIAVEEEVIIVQTQEAPGNQTTFLNETELNMTTFTANGELNATTYTANESLSQTMLMAQLQVNQEQEDLLRQREQEWKSKYAQQNDKIQSLRYQVQHLQNALTEEKKHANQTIQELETFSGEMQAAGQHHQEQITQMQLSIVQSNEQLQLCNIWRSQAEDSLQQSESELEQIRFENRALKQKLFSNELDIQIKEMNQQMVIEELQLTLTQSSSRQSQSESALEDQCELLRWQLALEEQKHLRTKQQVEILIVNSSSYEEQSEILKQELREMQRNLSETAEKYEREKDQQLKEIVFKSTTEKEQLKDQFKKQIIELQTSLKRADNDKQLKQQEITRQLQEKDSLHWQQIEQIEASRQREVQEMQQKIEMQSQHLQVSIRSEQQQIKKQIFSLESVLSKKDQDLQVVLDKNEEVQQELESMNEMRHKLNDHIVYLQNEIRKRDELLEGESDFEDADCLNDDSYISNAYSQHDSNAAQPQITQRKTKKQPVSQAILEEARSQIKSLLESNIQLKKQVNSFTQTISQLQGGLEQICQLFTSETSQDTLDMSEDLVGVIIQKFFELKNAHEVFGIEKQHQIDLLKISKEDKENLKFDIELLSSEKEMLQQDLTEMSELAEETKKQLSEANVKAQKLIKDHQKELQNVEEFYKQRIVKLQQDNEQAIAESEVVVTSLRQKIALKEEQVSQITARKKHMQIDLDHNLSQIKDLTSRLSQANQNTTDMCNQLEARLEEALSIKEQVETQLHHQQRKEKELEEQIIKLEEALHEKINELKQQQSQHTQLSSEFENVAQAFIQKKQIYKQTITKLKQQNQASSLDQQEVLELKAQLSQADTLIQQMQTETEQIVNRLQEKRTQREQKLKQKITELEMENQRLTSTPPVSDTSPKQIQEYKDDLNILRNNYASETKIKDEEIIQLRGQIEQIKQTLTSTSQVESLVKEDLQQLQQELNLKNDQLIQLREVITQHKEAYQAIQEQSQSSQQAMLDQINQLQQELAQEKESQARLMVESDDSQQMNEKLKAYSQSNQLLQKKLDEVQAELAQNNEIKDQMENTYQEESQKLAVLFKQKQGELREKNQKMKNDMRELLEQCQKMEAENVTSQETIAKLQTDLQSLQQEKLNMSQSLDLTKIQTGKDQSQFKLLEQELEHQLQRQLETLKDLLRVHQNILPSTKEDLAEFEQVVEMLATILRNAAEDKHHLVQLVQDRDEMREENESLIYKIKYLVQERDAVEKKLQQASDYKVLKQLEEEREGLRQDFLIKFDSISKELDKSSQENSVLKEKLSKFETTPTTVTATNTTPANRSFLRSFF